MLAQASAQRRHTSAAGTDASAQRRRELVLALVVLTSQCRQPAQEYGAGAGLAPAHMQVPPAACTLVHAHCPHVCSALASANDPHAAVRTTPFEALTATKKKVLTIRKKRLPYQNKLFLYIILGFRFRV